MKCGWNHHHTGHTQTDHRPGQTAAEGVAREAMSSEGAHPSLSKASIVGSGQRAHGAQSSKRKENRSIPEAKGETPAQGQLKLG